MGLVASGGILIDVCWNADRVTLFGCENPRRLLCPRASKPGTLGASPARFALVLVIWKKSAGRRIGLGWDPHAGTSRARTVDHPDGSIVSQFPWKVLA